jgi:6-phosphogluconolactonase
MSLAKRIARSSMFLSVACAIAACGGGGGGGGSQPPPPPPPPPPATYTVSATVSGLVGSGLLLEYNQTPSVSITQNGTVTFATGVPTNTAYTIGINSSPVSPIQNCTVTNGAGTVGTANVTATVVCTTQNARTAISLNYSSGTATGYYFDSANGELRLNELLALGTSPITFVGDKAGKFLFFLNQGSAQSYFGLPSVLQVPSSISAFAIDPLTQVSREVAGSPFATSEGQTAATGLAMLPGDAFLYVTNSSLNTIDAYSIGSTGALTPIAGSPFATGPAPNPITFDSAGHFAYVSNNTASSIFVYSVNGTTGALTEIQADRVATGVSPGQVSFTPDAKFAYVVNSPFSISGFSVNSATGALTAVAGSPFTVQTGAGIGNNPVSTLFFNPFARVLYVKMDGGTGVGWLSAYSIDIDSGALAPLSGSPYELGTSATAINVGMDPAARFLYIANQGSCTTANGCTPGPSSTGSISAFRMDGLGALTPLPGLPSVTPPPYQVSVDPSGEFLYQSSADTDQVFSYSIDQSTGALTLLPNGGMSRTGGIPVYAAAALTPDVTAPVTFKPRFAYVANTADNTISMFTTDPGTGKLAAIGTPIPSGNAAPQQIAVSLRGDFAYVVTAGAAPTTSTGLITAYSINAATGALSSVGTPVATGKGPAGVATDRTGRFVYVPNTYDGTVSSYLVNASGALSINGAPAPVGISNLIGVAVDPTGQNLYVLGANDVQVFEINPVSGAVVPSDVAYPAFGPSVAHIPLAEVTQITADPFGNFLYFPSFIGHGIEMCAISSYAGTAVSLQAINTGRANTSIAIDPTGRYAYTADYTDDTISAYAIDSGTGNLTPIGSPLPVGADAYSVSVDYSGKFVYAVLANKLVVTFSIGSTGALTAVAGGSVPVGNSAVSITTVGTAQ